MMYLEYSHSETRIGGRERNRELFFIGWRVFVWDDEKCPRDGCTTV